MPKIYFEGHIPRKYLDWLVFDTDYDGWLPEELEDMANHMSVCMSCRGYLEKLERERKEQQEKAATARRLHEEAARLSWY